MKRLIGLAAAALAGFAIAALAVTGAGASPGDHTCADHEYQQTDGTHDDEGNGIGCENLPPVVSVVPEHEFQLVMQSSYAFAQPGKWGSIAAQERRIKTLVRKHSAVNIRAKARETREAEEAEAARLAELASRPKVEVRSVTIRGCGYNDCMRITLRNNTQKTITDIDGTIYPRDRWGNAFTRCGYYGSGWTWWGVRGRGNGQTFTIEVDEACLRGLGGKSSFTLSRVMFSDGTTWPW